VVFLVACIVGYVVYQDSKGTSPGQYTAAPPKGDLLAGLTAAATAVVVLAFLLGLSADSSPGEGSAPAPAPSPAAPSEPFHTPSVSSSTG
jgi:hypothetical protein